MDEEGFIYLSGGTHSSDYPVTEGVYDTSFNGEGQWAGDVFLTKLNPTGSEIIFSTFIGGEVEETVGTEGIRIDSKGNIIIVGTTRSHDFPLTKGVMRAGSSYNNNISFRINLNTFCSYCFFNFTSNKCRKNNFSSSWV